MPIYEYKCLICGMHFEKMQKISDPPLKVCENCGGTLEKQWSLSGFQFKGEGWYVTDYANKKGGKTEKAEKNSTSESTAKPENASKEKTSTKDSGSKKKE